MKVLSSVRPALFLGGTRYPYCEALSRTLFSPLHFQSCELPFCLCGGFTSHFSRPHRFWEGTQEVTLLLSNTSVVAAALLCVCVCARIHVYVRVSVYFPRITEHQYFIQTPHLGCTRLIRSPFCVRADGGSGHPSLESWMFWKGAGWCGRERPTLSAQGLLFMCLLGKPLLSGPHFHPFLVERRSGGASAHQARP